LVCRGIEIGIFLHISMTNKSRLIISIDEEILLQFKNYCKNKLFKVSTKLEDMIKKELLENAKTN